MDISTKYITLGRPSCQNYLHRRCCLIFGCYILLNCWMKYFDNKFAIRIKRYIFGYIHQIYHTRSPQLSKLSALALLSYIWMLHFAEMFGWNIWKKYLQSVKKDISLDISNKIFHTRSPQLPKLSAPALLSYICM